MELKSKILFVEYLSKQISFQVRWLTMNERRNSTADGKGSESTPDVTAIILRILNLSKQVMEFIDVDVASQLPSERLDEIIRDSLLELYRLPSVAEKFQAETLAFYNWWGRHIRTWSHQSLSFRHLKAMMDEIKDHMRIPASRSFQFKHRSPGANDRLYSARRVSFSKISPLGKTLGSCLSDFTNSPSRVTSLHGNVLWSVNTLEAMEDRAETPSSRAQPPVETVYIMPSRRGQRRRMSDFSTTSTHAAISDALELLEDRFDGEEERIIRETNIRMRSSSLFLGLTEGIHPMCKKRKRDMA